MGNLSMGLYLNRNGESSHLFQRSADRIYSIDEEWYFNIRRGYDQGPYESEVDTRQALISFVQEQLEFESSLGSKKANTL